MKKTMLTAAMVIGCFFLANAKSSKTNQPLPVVSVEKEVQLNENYAFQRIWVTTTCGVEFPINTELGETIGSILYTAMVDEEFFCGEW